MVKKAKVIDVDGVKYVSEAHHAKETQELLGQIKALKARLFMEKPEGGIIFSLDPEKAKRSETWMKEHACRLRGKPLKAAIGEGPAYHFCDTSIGRMETISCPCGERLFLSDDL